MKIDSDVTVFVWIIPLSNGTVVQKPIGYSDRSYRDYRKTLRGLPASCVSVHGEWPYQWTDTVVQETWLLPAFGSLVIVAVVQETFGSLVVTGRISGVKSFVPQICVRCVKLICSRRESTLKS